MSESPSIAPGGLVTRDAERAGAKALYEWRGEDDDCSWEELCASGSSYRSQVMGEARAVLRAAAPLIAAAALHQYAARLRDERAPNAAFLTDLAAYRLSAPTAEETTDA